MPSLTRRLSSATTTLSDMANKDIRIIGRSQPRPLTSASRTAPGACAHPGARRGVRARTRAGEQAALISDSRCRLRGLQEPGPASARIPQGGNRC